MSQVLTVAALCLGLGFPAAAPAISASRGTGRAALQRVVDDVRLRLGIERAVEVAVVAANPYLMSVETPEAEGGAFVLEVEEALLHLLSEDELEAALAHELGHVWVFTHHPYLQTERLANEIAMRAVSRDALARVYEKVWKRDGSKGDLAAFLGQ